MKDPIQQAARLGQAKRYREAEALLLGVLQSAPEDKRALHMLASIAEVQDDLSRAADVLRRAASAHPKDFVINAHLSSILRRMGRLEESLTYGLRASALRPDDAVVLNDMALIYMELGDDEAARPYLERAHRLQPNLAEAYNNLGLIAQRAGRLKDAVSWFEKYLALKPDAAHAYVNLLDSYTVRDDRDAHLQELERKLAGLLSDEERMLLLFAQSKAYLDLGRRREALEVAIQACRLKRASIRYDEAGMLRYFEGVQRLFAPEFISSMRGCGVRGSKPIFIVSMPRSGSTLVEQILSSHPSVFGAGELSELPDAVAREQLADPDYLRKDAAAAFKRIGAAYLKGIQKRAPDAAHVTDKMPGNFFLTGLIHLALPDAKIVHVRRRPVDTCVSCFMRYFAKEQNHTYDLAELGRYYRAYDRLMKHWSETLPPEAMLEVRYERLVGDFENEARRLLAFCGVPWDDAVLRFHENRRPVATASVAQVRRPLYGTSIGRWEDCKDLLQPLLRELGDLAG